MKIISGDMIRSMHIFQPLKSLKMALCSEMFFDEQNFIAFDYFPLKVVPAEITFRLRTLVSVLFRAMRSFK